MGQSKILFNGKSKHITLSAPILLSWLYYGKSLEAMVSMVSRQTRNPKADNTDRRSCSFAARQIINVSIKNSFRTRADWDKYFAMNEANNASSESAANITADTDRASKVQHTAGKEKIQARPLIDYLDCENKEAVIQCICNFVTAEHKCRSMY